MASTKAHYAGFSLLGEKELIKKLNGLGPRVYGRVLKRATRKAWTPVVKSAKSRAPRESGLLRKSIGIKQKTYPRAGRIATIVGPRTGFAQTVTVNTPKGPREVKRDPVRYAHLVELGTAPHSTAKDVSYYTQHWKGKIEALAKGMTFQDDHPGSAPKPFMRPAFDGNKARAVSTMKTELAAGVVREAKAA